MAVNVNNIESGVQLFSRVNNRNERLIHLNEKFFGDENLLNMNVEIVSDYSTDRNRLLVDFIIRSILPTTLNKNWKNCGLIFINTNFQIGVFQIIKTMDQHLKDMNVKNRKQIIEESLQNLILLNCFNWTQLEVTIYSLEEKIKKRPNICTLILDDITAFYWIKKQEQDMLSAFMHSQKVFSLISGIIKSLNLLFVFGRTENNESNQDKRLSQSIDFQIIISKKNDTAFEAIVRSYKSDQINTVSFSNILFKTVFH
ncbi:DNA repair protein XRCC2-like [Coccinella septempunctata]|uniref:DNA repair protein XRCC2-like n=1 Tax=Coccinella septempunctata TaxID=41139 RepID=UPI001D09886B|nr:DNA repair protein XRCC2-like [Coccinella septempunctata]